MSTAIKHALTTQDGRSTLTAYNPGASEPLKTVDSSHPHFDEIVAGVQSGDESVWDLFDVAAGIMDKFSQVTDRVSWNGSEVLFDGDPVHNVLSEQLGRAISEGKSANYLALARFWEKLESNPVEHSRQQAYDFLAAHAFQITADGNVVGFKGVNKDGDTYRSWAASEVQDKPSGFVNGEAIPPRRTIPQRVGDVVTMPRSEVAHDPSQACKRGLHVATYDYANGYGNTVLEVHIDPRDIVSVPNDASGKKVRVWKYTVARVALEKDAYGDRTVISESPNTAAWAGDVGYRV